MTSAEDIVGERSSWKTKKVVKIWGFLSFYEVKDGNFQVFLVFFVSFILRDYNGWDQAV